MEPNEVINLQMSGYLLVIKRRWLVAVIIFFSTFACSIAATKLLKPSYEAQGKLLFKEPTFNVLGSNLLPNSSEGDSGDLRSLVATQNPISTQMEVITSPPVLEGAINKLGLKDKTGKPLTAAALKGALSLKIIGGTDVLQVSYKSHDPQEAAKVVDAIMQIYLNTDVFSNRKEAGTTRRFMEKQIQKTQVDVVQAELALSKFKQKRHLLDLAEQTRTIILTISNLDNAINSAKSELKQLNAQADELRRKIGFSSQDILAISSLNQSLAVQSTLTQLNDTERQIATERGRFLDSSPPMVSLWERKANLNAFLQQQIAQTIGTRRSIPTKLLQIGTLKQDLIINFLQTDVQRLGLKQKLISLNNSRLLYRRESKNLPKFEQIQGELQRKLDVAQSTYQTLLKKIQELEVAENQSTASARIIAHAEVPKKPVTGKNPIILFLGILLGGLLGSTAILILEMSDRSLKTLKEIQGAFRYTLLGIIPLFPQKGYPDLPLKKYDSIYKILQLIKNLPVPRQDMELATSEIAVVKAPYSLISETYRMLQANLRFLSSDKLLKLIVITSAISQEGKSTVAANLAAAIAQLERQVLLIDANMRTPHQHHLWQLNNGLGLSDILVDRAKFDDVRSKVIDNLDVLPAGTIPPNPLTLIDSHRMAKLIAGFASQYDFVIIDAPSLLIAPDALTLSRMTDGILLVSRPGLIDFSNARSAKDMLKRTGCNVLGLIINGLIAENESDNYFYHPKEHLNPSKTREKHKLSN